MSSQNVEALTLSISEYDHIGYKDLNKLKERHYCGSNPIWLASLQEYEEMPGVYGHRMLTIKDRWEGGHL
jgi:hypothetical protein